jgi:nicotinate-nucleotide adenylyltransferase
MDVTHISTLRKIGILGGSFNPVHQGHLLMAETARDQFGLDQVIWVPTHHPPHKSDAQLLAFEHRWRMVEAAIADHPKFTATDLERQQPTPSYASQTFTQLRITYPHTDWYWIIGVDAFQHLCSWHHAETLAAQCTWLVAPRQPIPLTQVGLEVAAAFTQQAIALRWQPLPMPSTAISSSLIRQYCQMGRSLRYLVPDPVRDYINTHQLYQQKPIDQ